LYDRSRCGRGKDGSFNDLSGKIIKCLADKKMKQTQVRAAYLTYLKEFPAQKSDTRRRTSLNR
jgi:hypothetical protein